MKPPKSSRNDVFVHYKLWLSSVSGEGIIGDGKIRLLEAIRDSGSLSAAAERMGLSYRKAWGDIRKAEALLGYPLTEKHRGGKDGGSSTLTPQAIRLLEAYKALQVQTEKSVEKAFREFTDKVQREE
ncbi:MAG: LysR family transcriptional regulator [Bacteroidales bacterium]